MGGSRLGAGGSNVEVAPHDNKVYSHLVSDDAFHAKDRLLGSGLDPGKSNIEVASLNNEVYSHLVSDDAFDAEGRLLGAGFGGSNVEVASLDDKVYFLVSDDAFDAKERLLGSRLHSSESNVKAASLDHNVVSHSPSDDAIGAKWRLDPGEMHTNMVESCAAMDSEARKDAFLLAVLVLKSIVDELLEVALRCKTMPLESKCENGSVVPEQLAVTAG